mmetsp:Transcript_29439/g.85473  ORF Transcript_29439/g.85473 Transcript_29439/m.85473 type:complete len:475 (+) Transcript_29439:699-2123(+)
MSLLGGPVQRCSPLAQALHVRVGFNQSSAHADMPRHGSTAQRGALPRLDVGLQLEQVLDHIHVVAHGGRMECRSKQSGLAFSALTHHGLAVDIRATLEEKLDDIQVAAPRCRQQGQVHRAVGLGVKGNAVDQVADDIDVPRLCRGLQSAPIAIAPSADIGVTIGEQPQHLYMALLGGGVEGCGHRTRHGEASPSSDQGLDHVHVSRARGMVQGRAPLAVAGQSDLPGKGAEDDAILAVRWVDIDAGDIARRRPRHLQNNTLVAGLEDAAALEMDCSCDADSLPDVEVRLAGLQRHMDRSRGLQVSPRADQVAEDVRMVRGCRHVQRGLPVRHHGIDARSALDEKLDDLEVAVMGREVDGEEVGVTAIAICAMVQEQLHNFGVAGLRRRMHATPAAVRDRILVRPHLQQRADELSMAICRGGVHDCKALVCPSCHICPRLQQELDHIEVALLGGQHEGRLAVGRRGLVAAPRLKE